MTTWTDEDEIVIARLHGRYRIKTLSAILGRSPAAVSWRVTLMRKAGRLQIKGDMT